VGLVDYIVFFWAVFLLMLGLIFEASGFGVLVTGRLDGFIFIIIGIAMFWGGWALSGARSFPCAVAAVLNILDASSTVAFWSFEVNPFVLAAGPTIFLVAKLACSLAIMLYAKLHPAPGKGGTVMAAFFALIIAWNLGQYTLAFLGLADIIYGVFIGTFLSFLASATVFYVLFRSKVHTRRS